jgi:Kef-type K+ transport system membrane component KefB
MNVELVFGQIALLLSAAAAAGAIALVLRQPPLLAYLAVGVAAGPTWLRLTTAEEAIELLAMLGIAVLLFIVGLKLDLHVVKMMGPIALLLGAGQVTLTFLAGYPIAWALGLDPTDALYVAVALTFSSTIIVVKLLSDQRQIDALHGRLALGILIVQDIVVIAILVVLSAFGQTTGNQSLPWHALLLVVKIILLITGAGLAAKYLMPRLAPLLARSSEVLVLSALGWALALATAASALGLSKEVGAFLAGFSLASTAFRDAIGGRLVSLRDFLLLFFFLNLGAELDFSHISVQIGPAIALVLFVLLG